MLERKIERAQRHKRKRKNLQERLQEQRLTMSVDEAAAKIGICRSHAYSLANAGGLPVIRMGRRLLVIRAAFDKLFAGGAA